MILLVEGNKQSSIPRSLPSSSYSPSSSSFQIPQTFYLQTICSYLSGLPSKRRSCQTYALESSFSFNKAHAFGFYLCSSSSSFFKFKSRLFPFHFLLLLASQLDFLSLLFETSSTSSTTFLFPQALVLSESNLPIRSSWGHLMRNQAFFASVVKSLSFLVNLQRSKTFKTQFIFCKLFSPSVLTTSFLIVVLFFSLVSPFLICRLFLYNSPCSRSFLLCFVFPLP